MFLRAQGIWYGELTLVICCGECEIPRFISVYTVKRKQNENKKTCKFKSGWVGKFDDTIIIANNTQRE